MILRICDFTESKVQEIDNLKILLSGNSSRRLSSPSYHMSYLKNSTGNHSKKSIKNPRKNSRTKKPRKNSNTSKKKYSYEVTVSKKSNLSFDISAQMEELFEITKDDKNLDEVFENGKENDEPKTDFQILGNLVKKEEEKLKAQNQDSGFCQQPQKSSKFEKNSGKSEKSKKRVSWGENEEKAHFSPCKKPKIQENETQDIFADSFVNLDDLDQVENLEKTCPKTPKFEACSEQFLVEKDENTISDSFLEAAFNTHLSEFSKKEENTFSPRSKKLQERRKLAKKAKQNAISPGFIQSDSENESENFENLKAIPKVEDPIFKIPDIKSPKHESNSSQKDTLNVIDVCTNRTLFDTFKAEILEKSKFAMTLAVEKSQKTEENPSNGIGQRVTRRNNPKPKIDEKCVIPDFGLKITGVAFSYGSGLNAYFLALSDIKSQSSDDTIAPQTQDESISLNEKIDFLKSLLKNGQKKVAIFDAKMALKFLMLGLGIQISPGKKCFLFFKKSFEF